MIESMAVWGAEHGIQLRGGEGLPGAAQDDVAVQSFVVRTDMGCGSTIGPITAGGTGVRTLDIGVPTFAMHSIRELAGTLDAHALCRVLQRFYDYRVRLSAI